jgi:predicted lysophospholipase L1 biosynthesis ABC-type transport system permease subunit
MEKRAFTLKDEEPSGFVGASAAIQDPPSSKIVPYRPLVSVPFAEGRVLQTRTRKRRERLLTFIKLEGAACVVLVLLLVAGTSQRFAQADLTLAFEIGILVAASAVAIIPAIFYGPTRPKYRGRRYRRD